MLSCSNPSKEVWSSLRRALAPHSCEHKGKKPPSHSENLASIDTHNTAQHLACSECLKNVCLIEDSDLPSLKMLNTKDGRRKLLVLDHWNQPHLWYKYISELKQGRENRQRIQFVLLPKRVLTNHSLRKSQGCLEIRIE